MSEIWKPCLGYEGLYEVSSLGRVKSLSRQTMGRWGELKTSPGVVLKHEIGKKGYHRVYLSAYGKVKKSLVHRQVALAFIPNPDNKPCVNHKDTDPSNNELSNLEWCTYKENMEHAVKYGRMIYPNYIKSKNQSLYCRNGHLFTDQNTRVDPKTSQRYCRTCADANRRRHRLRTRLGVDTNKDKEI